MYLEADLLRLTSDAALMADFAKSQAREVLEHYLERLGDHYTTNLVNYRSRTLDEVTYEQGILAGLRMAQQIPENVMTWAKRAAGEEGKVGKLTLA